MAAEAAAEAEAGGGAGGVPRGGAKFCETFAPPVCDETEDPSASLAMRAALIHVIGDIVQNIGAVIAGTLIWWQPFDLGVTHEGVSRWCYVDVSITLIYLTLVALTTFGTTREVLVNLLLACPAALDIAAFQQQLEEVPGVVGTHDLHVWQIGQSRVCTVHVVILDASQRSRVMASCSEVSQRRHHAVDHATFQIEVWGGECLPQSC